METKTFPIFEDPGHGWLRVPIVLLQELGIAHNISKFSYMKGSFAYLEEDCDAPFFVDAMDKMDVEVKFIEHHTDKESPIREYDSYKEDAL